MAFSLIVLVFGSLFAMSYGQQGIHRFPPAEPNYPEMSTYAPAAPLPPHATDPKLDEFVSTLIEGERAHKFRPAEASYPEMTTYAPAEELPAAAGPNPNLDDILAMRAEEADPSEWGGEETRRLADDSSGGGMIRFDRANPRFAMHSVDYPQRLPLENDGNTRMRVPFEEVSSLEQEDVSMSNPAAYFLKGADFCKLRSSPKCRMLDCIGPFPNDGNVNLPPFDDSVNSKETCHRNFVPLNPCVNDKGYPVGMVCTICCECSTEFVREMEKSRGVREGTFFQ